MANAEKTATIEDLAGKFRDSSGAVLTEYRGLTVAQLAELRSNLRGNATFNVTKNTLAKVAATQAGVGDQVSLKSRFTQEPRRGFETVVCCPVCASRPGHSSSSGEMQETTHRKEAHGKRREDGQDRRPHGQVPRL